MTAHTASSTSDPIDDHDKRFRDFARTGDSRLRHELVEAHLGLVKRLARGFLHRGQPYDDLVQVGALALVKAVDRFDPDRGVQFTTYATKTIVGELKRHFRDTAWAVRAPRRLQELSLELHDTAGTLAQTLGLGTRRRRAGVSGRRHREGRRRRACVAGQAYATTSLDSSSSAFDSSDGPEPLVARLGDEDAAIGDVEWRIVFRPHLAALPHRDRAILWYRLVDGLNYREIAARVGLSTMQVSRLLARSLATLRDACGEALTAS